MRIEGVLAAGVACAVLAACGGTDVPPDDAPATTASAEVPDLPTFSVEALLAEVPLSAVQGERFDLRVGDLRAASTLAGVELPTDAASAPAWINSLVGTGEDPQVFVPLDLPLSPRAPAALVEEDLGWSVADVDRYISWGDSVRITTVVAGRIDDQDLADLPVADGIHTAGEGEDLGGTLETASPARPTGMPLRMRSDGPWLISSPYTEVVTQWRSDAETLANFAALVEMARLLDDRATYAAQVTTSPPLTECAIRAPRIQELGFTTDSLADVDAYALGWASRDGAPAMTVIHHDADGRDVAESAGRLEALWTGPAATRGQMADMVSVEDVSVERENVVVDLRPADGFGPEVLDLLAYGVELPFCTP